MIRNVLIYLMIFSFAFLGVLPACKDKAKDEDTVYRKPPHSDDDTVSVDDDADDTSHWDDDADDDAVDDAADDSTDDDDVDDATDDATDDDTTDDDVQDYGVNGYVVGVNEAGDRAFFGTVHGGAVAQNVIPFADDIILNAVDCLPTGYGVTVGEETVNSIGFAFEIQDETLTALSLPYLENDWRLVDVSVPAEGLAYMAGNQSNDASSMNGVIFSYSEGISTAMTTPALAESWQLRSVSFFSPFKGWAVGLYDISYKPLILGYNGFSWEVYDVPASDDVNILLAVDGASSTFACAMGRTIPQGMTQYRGYALVYDGVSWSPTFIFPDDGLNWNFNALAAFSSGEVISYVIKNNRLERWRFDGYNWNRNVTAQTFLPGSSVSSMSFLGVDNGLIAVANSDGINGKVVQVYDGVISVINDGSTTLGVANDAVALGVE